MSISSISSLLTQLNTNQNPASSSSATNSTSHTVKETAANAAPSPSDSSDLLQSALVTLSSGKSSDSDTGSLSLYDAKGLLMKVKSSLMQDNPLYATGSGSAEASDFSGAYSNTTSSDSTDSSSTSELDTKIEALLKKYAGKDSATQTSEGSGTNTGNTTSGNSSKGKA